jgi:transketolase
MTAHERYRYLSSVIRVNALSMVHCGGASHVGTCLSIAEILAVLYGGVLRVESANPTAPERDRFILSKGHGCASLYAVLAARGFFPQEWLEGFYRNGGKLFGHATHCGVPGVEFSTGSLGHGLSVGCGMALASKRDGLASRVFVLLSDGECDEGSTWEAALFASHHGLGNLTAIVDYNRMQALGNVSDILELEPFCSKWVAFGWDVTEVDGHSIVSLEKALSQRGHEKPVCVVAHTVKGKGVSFMENSLLWHYRCPDETEMGRALAELEFFE